MEKMNMKKNYQIVACLAFAFGFFVHSSQAQTSTNLFWDLNGTNAGIGGSGSWTTTGTSWTTNSAGTNAFISGNWSKTNPVWNTAIFQGTSGTVTNNTSLYFNQIQVNTNGFTLTTFSGGNAYYYSSNSIAGIVLADGVTLNLSGIAAGYNSNALGISGNITNAPGSNGYSTIAITGNSGTTNGSGIRILSRFSTFVTTGTNTNVTYPYWTNGTGGTNNWYVKVNVKTTGTGGAILGTADASSVLNLRGAVTVDNGSLLILSPGGTNSRQIQVYSNIITSAANAVQIGDPIISPATNSSN
jgi:fibronectin-binding autotransporter adhesin